MKTLQFTLLSLVAVIGLFLSGCGKGDAPKPSAAKNESEHHEHGEGPHGGTIIDWGGGKYHVEFTVDHDKKEAAVYILGDDAKTAVPVATKNGELLLSINQPAFQVVLKASPALGDTEGASSRYVGTHENLATVQEFAGTISGEIGGIPYAGDFKEEPHDH